MKQLIGFINYKYLDTSNLTPTQNIFNYRNIINNPSSYDTGDIILDSTTLVQISDINFAHLYCYDNTFKLTVITNEGNLELVTKEFSYNNSSTTIDIILERPTDTTSSITVSKLTGVYNPNEESIYY